jgi:hypothetical protein
MKKGISFILILCMIVLNACQETEEEIVIEDTDYVFTETLGDEIPIASMEIPYSEVKGNQDNFVNIFKPKDINPIYFMESQIKTHQVIFNFEHSFPMSEMTIYNPKLEDAVNISNISIYYSLNGTKYEKLYEDYELNSDDNVIALNSLLIKSIKLIFDTNDENISFSDISFYLGDGYIIKEDLEMSDAFLRYDGWTGADGIFSFDMNNGGDQIGVDHATTGFVFSDTFVGEVYENNKLRKSSVMLNNSFGYLSHDGEFNRDQLSFDYPETEDGATTPIVPDVYVGTKARNLLSNDGLNPSYDVNGLLTNENTGTMWLSDEIDNEINISLSEINTLSKIYLWNYNDTPNLGVKSFKLYRSIDGDTYDVIDTYAMNQASGNDNEPYTLEIDLNLIQAKYIKIEILESYSSEQVGLGKILLLDENNNYVFGEATADVENTTISENEETARLWIQDGVIINQKLYVFPILVKDTVDLFEVTDVSMVEIPIENERFAYEDAAYYNTSLMSRTDDGGVIYYGAGLMDNTQNDGYIYIYGYKDLNGRNLVVARFLPTDILNINAWTYYDGQDWSNDINDSAPLINHVSAELSVTYMAEGQYAGKYMLMVMEDTSSGMISYSISDTPYGTFSNYNQIYETDESSLYIGAFSYNAKLHPNLSTYDRLVISYNVNTIYVGQLSDARIYYPRFIVMEAVNKN